VAVRRDYCVPGYELKREPDSSAALERSEKPTVQYQCDAPAKVISFWNGAIDVRDLGIGPVSYVFLGCTDTTRYRLQR
jgi:hypothetical protein